MCDRVTNTIEKNQSAHTHFLSLSGRRDFGNSDDFLFALHKHDVLTFVLPILFTT